MKGSYVLLIKITNDQNIKIGKLGRIFFKKGFYAYVGSAMNSLDARIARHLRPEKKLHWHIDYLLKTAEINKIFYKETNEKIECYIANKFSGKLENIQGFGCSDCKCTSHLFYGKQKEIEKIGKELSLNIKNIQNP